MILPPQKLSSADKLARHETTDRNNIEETIDFYLEQCNWGKQTDEILSLYKAVEGQLVDDYSLIQNPFNQEKTADTSRYNAVLKNYNILKGIANLLMGEFGRRTHEYNVTSINPGDDFAFKDGLNLVIRNYYSQAIANQLAELGMDHGKEIVELLPLEKYVEEFKQSFDETRIISGQEILDYIKFNCDLDAKYIDELS